MKDDPRFRYSEATVRHLERQRDAWRDRALGMLAFSAVMAVANIALLGGWWRVGS